MSKKGQKFVVLCILLCLGIPGFYFTWKFAHAYLAPDLYEGDLLETRDCRNCDGTGEDLGMAQDYPELGTRCQFCRGKGRVQVIVPGPRRPTRVWGVVMEASTINRDPEKIDVPVKLRRIPNPLLPDSTPAIRGAIPEATIRFHAEGGEDFVIRTDRTGRFSQRLPPGSYSVEVSAPEFSTLTKEMEVAPLTEPIWLEKATLVRPADSDAEARSTYGLNLMVGLSREENEGTFSLAPGEPGS
jgi:hypothetical protein